MTALAYTDWTVAHVARGSEHGMLHKSHVIDLTIGDGAKTYPTNGIPLPTLATLGFNKAILFVETMQPSNGYIPAFDISNHKMKLLSSGAASTHTHTLTPLGTVAAPTFSGSALAGHTHTESGTTTSSDSAGTPAGTVSAPAFTGSSTTTAAGGAISAAALSEIAASVTPAQFTVRVRITGL